MGNKTRFVLLIFAAILALCAGAVLAVETVTVSPGDVVEAEDEAVYKSSGTSGPSWPGVWYFYSNGYLEVNVDIPQDGYYRVLIAARGKPAGGIWPECRYADSVPNHYFNPVWVVNTSTISVLIGEPMWYDAGVYSVQLLYENDAQIGGEDRDLYLDWFTIIPASGPGEPMDMNYQVKGQPLSSYGQAIYPDRYRTPNYLPDGDFENSQNGWKNYEPSATPGTFSYNYRDPAAARFGTYGGSIMSTDSANKLEMINTGYLFVPPMEQRKDLIFTGWYKASPGFAGDAYISVKFYDADRKYFGGGPKVYLPKPTEEWQYFSFVLTKAQMPAALNYLIIGYSLEYGLGTLYYDGLAIYPAEILGPNNFPLTVEAVGGGQLKLSWEAQEYNKLYEIHKGATEDFAPSENTLVDVVEDGSATYIDQNPELETLAYYKVVAINLLLSKQESMPHLNDVIPPNRPEPPSVSTEKGGIVIVTWQKPSQAVDGEYASKYLIYKSQDPATLGSGSPVHEAPADGPFQWWDRNVVPGQEYYYAVKCIDRVGNESLLSLPSEKAVPTPDTLPPLPALNAAISPTTVRGGLTLTWKQPTTAADDGDFPVEYLVYRSANPIEAADYREVVENYDQISDSILVVGQTEFSFLDNQVEAGKQYYYYIVGLDLAGNGALSTLLSAQPQAAAIPKPISPDESAPALNRGTVFTWEEPVVYYEDDPDYTDTVVSYTLEYAKEADFSDAVTETGITGTSFTLPANRKLEAGTYYWRVKAHYASTVSSPFSEPLAFVSVVTEADPLAASYLDISPRVIRANGMSKISYVLSEDAVVTLKVFNSKGRVVRTLVCGQFQPSQVEGEPQVYTIEWNGQDEHGKFLADGLYIIQLVAERPQKQPQILHRKFQVFRNH